MENYKRYRAAYPDKSDAQIIEALANELKQKIERIHELLDENAHLKKTVASRVREDWYKSL